MAEIKVNPVGGAALPSILEINKSKSGNSLIGVFEKGIKVGDIIIPFHTHENFVVNEIVEERKPKGDWSGKSYEGKNPTYYKFSVTPFDRNAPKAN